MTWRIEARIPRAHAIEYSAEYKGWKLTDSDGTMYITQAWLDDRPECAFALEMQRRALESTHARSRTGGNPRRRGRLTMCMDEPVIVSLAVRGTYFVLGYLAACVVLRWRR